MSFNESWRTTMRCTVRMVRAYSSSSGVIVRYTGWLPVVLVNAPTAPTAIFSFSAFVTLSRCSGEFMESSRGQ